MDWDPDRLVVWRGAKLLSRPDMTTRQVKGIETPQRFGRAVFDVELDSEVRHIHVGHYYWDAAIEQFAAIEGDIVNVTFLPYPWSFQGRSEVKSGTKYYFYKIEES